jgi:hypothetical protein
MRSLTNAEYNAGEEIKFGVLFSLEPFTELNAENILNAFGQANNLEEDFYNTYRILSTSSSRELGRALNFDELRYIQVHLYSEINSEDL